MLHLFIVLTHLLVSPLDTGTCLHLATHPLSVSLQYSVLPRLAPSSWELALCLHQALLALDLRLKAKDRQKSDITRKEKSWKTAMEVNRDTIRTGTLQAILRA
jgi:hypothetical protein